MVGYQIDGFKYRRRGIVEAVEPGIEIDAAMPHKAYMLVIDTAFLHQMEHLPCIHTLNPATGVTDDHYLIDAKFINGYQQTAYGAVERIGHHGTRILDQLDVAVPDAQGGRQQCHQARIHTGKYGYLFVRILARLVFFVFSGLDKFSIVLENGVYHIIYTVIYRYIYCYISLCIVIYL